MGFTRNGLSDIVFGLQGGILVLGLCGVILDLRGVSFDNMVFWIEQGLWVGFLDLVGCVGTWGFVFGGWEVFWDWAIWFWNSVG